MTDWSWKVKDGASGRLLYENGNWGDLLKAAWIRILATGLADAFGAVRAVDAFAGAPDYPLAARVAQRARRAAADLPDLARALAPHLDREVWPGSSLLLADALGTTAPDGTDPRVSVCEIDATRRTALAKNPRLRMLDCVNGYDALDDAFDPGPTGLILIDPYDLLADWRVVLPRLAARARTTTVLAYLYNRSGRSRERLKEYRAFRAALDAARPAAPKRIGRLPADPFLPDAWHEMLWLPGARAADRPERVSWTAALEQTTLRLAEASRHASLLEE